MNLLDKKLLQVSEEQWLDAIIECEIGLLTEIRNVLEQATLQVSLK